MILHPDDHGVFLTIKASMERVAREYGLPLRSVTHLPDERVGFDTDRWGDCDREGNIRLLLRAKVDGAWTDAPLSPKEVLRTAAHELAHLRYFEHGPEHNSFQAELETALSNVKEDHRERVLRKLVKMQAQAQSEAKLGNSEAAEAFATAINRLLIEHELHPSDIEYAKATSEDPIVEVPVALESYDIRVSKVRVAWQESLARIVAKAHMCTFLLRPKSNQIWFVGTKSHATVAEYAYGTLVSRANDMAHAARQRYWAEQGWGQEGVSKSQAAADMHKAMAFREAWLDAFVQRVGQRFAEARRAAEDAWRATAAPSGSTALMRLDGQLIKVQQYIDAKFKGAKKTAGQLSRRNNLDQPEARARGREAADSVVLGRKGVTGQQQHKSLPTAK